MRSEDGERHAGLDARREPHDRVARHAHAAVGYGSPHRAGRPRPCTGGLAATRLAWSGDWAVTLVLASAGYPASASKGDVIAGLDIALRAVRRA